MVTQTIRARIGSQGNINSNRKSPVPSVVTIKTDKNIKAEIQKGSSVEQVEIIYWLDDGFF